jgi:PPOX class probable FMN-dependent enzyme
MFKDKILSIEELRAIYSQPSARAVMKQRPELDMHSRAFIALSPFVLVATADETGRCDVSPKGDAPGFVQVLDETHLVIPDRPGNNRLDGLTNLIGNPKIGLLFLIPGREDTLRVNGNAWIVCDAELLAALAVDGKQPKTAIGIEVTEVFVHCPKAFMRSHLWKPEQWPAANALPSMCEMLWDQLPQKPEGFRDAQEFDTALSGLMEKTLY